MTINAVSSRYGYLSSLLFAFTLKNAEIWCKSGYLSKYHTLHGSIKAFSFSHQNTQQDDFQQVMPLFYPPSAFRGLQEHRAGIYEVSGSHQKNF